jgi:DNA repair exonuclease SbcCD nuclease subunit
LRSLALRDPALAELVADATRQAFSRIVALCLDERVDALLIAGDLYDGDQTSMKTARFIGEAFRRLAEAGVRVFLIRGNHDNLSRITRELSLPPGITPFGARAGVELIERPVGRSIAVHGLSFSSDKAPASLLPGYRAPVEGAVNIGLLHTSLGGSPGHSTYAPCTAADLARTGFSYWALGHIHKRSVIEGPTAIVMPGMPQGRDINEDGPKSVTLATVADDGAIALEERVVGPAVFARSTVDLTGVDDMAEAARKAGRAAAQLRSAFAAEHLILRIRLVGRTPLAWRLRRDRDRAAEEIALAFGEGRGLWLEKIEIDAREAEGAEAASGAAAELARIAAAQVLPSEGFREVARALARDFATRHAPAELRGLLGDDEAAEAAAVAALAAEGVDDVLARLLAAGPEETS